MRRIEDEKAHGPAAPRARAGERAARYGSFLAAAAIALAAAAWSGGEPVDRPILSEPPQAVVEAFVRRLAERRADRAVPYLCGRVAERYTASALREAAARLEAQEGDIVDVRAELVSVAGERAFVRAAVATDCGATLSLEFQLRRERGAWAIDDLGAIGTFEPRSRAWSPAHLAAAVAGP